MVLTTTSLHRLWWVHNVTPLSPGASDLLLRPGPPHLRELQSGTPTHSPIPHRPFHDPFLRTKFGWNGCSFAGDKELGAGATACDMRISGGMRLVWVAIRALAVHGVFRDIRDLSGHIQVPILGGVRDEADDWSAVGTGGAGDVLAGVPGLPFGDAGVRWSWFGRFPGLVVVLVCASFLPSQVQAIRAVPVLSLLPDQG